MIREPKRLECKNCKSPATVQILNSSTSVIDCYCSNHEPNLRLGEKTDLEIQRFRLNPNSACSQALSASTDSKEHKALQHDMCETQLLGGIGTCQYFLSRLTGIDQFALWEDEFLQNIREFVIDRTNDEASRIPFDANTVGFMAPYFRKTFLESERGSKYRPTKQEIAVCLLLSNPTWTDELISLHVPTTLKQLARNTNYCAIRRAIDSDSLMELHKPSEATC